MSKFANRNSRGFTILELMIGMALFLIISGSVLIGMSQYQQGYRTAEISTQMQQQLRSTMELMASEIGQAGLQSSNAEGASTMGNAAVTAPYSITPQVTPAMVGVVNQVVALATNSSTLEQPYVGQWLMVADGANQEPIQVSEIPPTVASGSIATQFGFTHPVGVPVYPMGVFPHGILAGSTVNSVADPSSAAISGGKLAMYGEINGSGNGLWAVEYACPTSYPGPLTRKAWNLSAFNTSNSPALPVATAYNLIDNVTACYFCWPGVSSTVNPNCPQGVATQDTVELKDGTATPTYTMITQVGFTITVTEPVTISGKTQNVTVTKSYSNIQPRNLVTADKIYNAACTSANGGTPVVPCTIAYGTYAQWLNGELQPDPPVIAWMSTYNYW